MQRRRCLGPGLGPEDVGAVLCGRSAAGVWRGRGGCSGSCPPSPAHACCGACVTRRSCARASLHFTAPPAPDGALQVQGDGGVHPAAPRRADGPQQAPQWRQRRREQAARVGGGGLAKGLCVSDAVECSIAASFPLPRCVLLQQWRSVFSCCCLKRRTPQAPCPTALICCATQLARPPGRFPCCCILTAPFSAVGIIGDSNPELLPLFT